MPSQTTKDIPILMVLFGEEKLVWQYKQLDDPGQKLAMIWRTPYFQVNHLLKSYLMMLEIQLSNGSMKQIFQMFVDV